MARKYTRDNRGRFASGGSGATARGGRLRTASGNKRKTQTMTVKNQRTVVLRKQDKPKSAATSRLRPGEFMNANAFPANAIAKSVANKKPTGYSTNKKANIALAKSQVAKFAPGVEILTKSSRTSRSIMETGSKGGKPFVRINTGSAYWDNPKKVGKELRASGFHSTGRAGGVVHHEIGHLKTPNPKSPKDGYYTASTKVGRYAGFTRHEFVAETYAGLKTGRKYTPDVMGTYREAQGKTAKPAARRRSRLK